MDRSDQDAWTAEEQLDGKVKRGQVALLGLHGFSLAALLIVYISHAPCRDETGRRRTRG